MNVNILLSHKRHLHNKKHICNLNNFKIISSAKNDFKLLIKESLLIESLLPELNRQSFN